MTTLIELHDHNIRISSQQSLLGESPGFANTFEFPPVFGADARGLTRLHPQQSFNQFWSQLGLDPLVSKNKLFRHHADIAFGHLESITKQYQLDGDAIFAVPSHYTANQLATLLGLVKHCSIRAVGLIDLALVALANLHEHQQAIFLDIQLHQSVLTLVRKLQGEIVREKVLPIPGTGLQSLHDAWANTITDAFIKQSRFDPLHNADTEQYIFNEIESWLKTIIDNKELLLEINNKGTVHQASLTLKNFEQRVKSIYDKINQEIEGVSLEGTPVYIREAVLKLPGLQQELPNIIAVSDGSIAENSFQHLNIIHSESDDLTLISRLPSIENQTKNKSSTTINSDASASFTKTPTHFLFEHKAYAITDINLTELKLSKPINISLQEQQYFLSADSDLELELNGTAITEPTALQIGDCLLVNQHSTIEFIQVQ